LHERIRRHSMDAGYAIKAEGQDGGLLERIAGDPAFGVTLAELQNTLNPSAFIGCAAMQTEDFLRNDVAACLGRYENLAAETMEITL